MRRHMTNTEIAGSLVPKQLTFARARAIYMQEKIEVVIMRGREASLDITFVCAVYFTAMITVYE
jgi:hypothetical protein